MTTTKYLNSNTFNCQEFFIICISYFKKKQLLLSWIIRHSPCQKKLLVITVIELISSSAVLVSIYAIISYVGDIFYSFLHLLVFNTKSLKERKASEEL